VLAAANLPVVVALGEALAEARAEMPSAHHRLAAQVEAALPAMTAGNQRAAAKQ